MIALLAQTQPFSLPSNIAFAIVAAAMVFAAVRVVTTQNIVHAALYLVVVLGGIGVNFLLLHAEFVAITQFLVYLGAIIVLFLFGIMLTRAPLGRSEHLDNETGKGIALAVSVFLFVVVGGATLASFRGQKLVFVDKFPQGNTQAVSDSIFSTYLIPFEVVSVMLLAALVGAIVLARKD